MSLRDQLNIEPGDQIVAEPTDWRPPDDATVDLDQPTAYLESVDLTDLLDGPPPAEEWLIEPILPRGRHTGLVATRGHGKSLVALDLAAKRAAGLPVLAEKGGDPVTVGYFDMEMGPDDLYERLTDLGWTTDHPAWPALIENLHYYQLIDIEPLDTETGGLQLEYLIERDRLDFVVLDTISKLIEGEENTNDTYTALFRHTERKLKRRGLTLLRLDHLGKDRERGSRGGSAKEDNLDVVWELTGGDGDRLSLKLTKGRLSWLPQMVTIEKTYDNGTLSHELPAVHLTDDLRDLIWLIESLGVAQDATVAVTMDALRKTGNGRRKADVAHAVRVRKSGTVGNQNALTRENTPGTKQPGTAPEPAGNQDSKTPPDQGKGPGTKHRNRPEPTPRNDSPPRGGNRYGSGSGTGSTFDDETEDIAP